MSKQNISQEWGAAYAEWLSALADMAKLNADVDQPELSDEESDTRTAKMNDRITDAEHQMLCIPVTIGWQLLQKFEVLQAMLVEIEKAGRPADGRHLLMTASVHSDLAHLDCITSLSVSE
jgi:hypothetical protein